MELLIGFVTVNVAKGDAERCAKGRKKGSVALHLSYRSSHQIAA